MGVCFVYPRVIKHGHGHGQISHLFDDFPIQIARLFCYVGFSTGCMPHQTWGISGDKKAHMTNLVCHDVYVKMGGIHCAP